MHNPENCPGCEKRAKERMEKYDSALKRVLATQDGRDVLDVILDRSGVHAPSLWEPSARLNYVVARRDFGQEIMNDIVRSDSKAYFTMQTDRFNRADVEAAAVEMEEKKGRK